MDFIIKPQNSWAKTNTDCLVMPLFDTSKASALFAAVDKEMGGVLSRLKKTKELSNKAGKVTTLYAPESASFKTLVTVGCGKKSDISAFRKNMTAAVNAVRATQSRNATVLLDAFDTEDADENTLIKHAANLWAIADYRYDETLSKKAEATRLKKVYLTSTLSAAKAKALASQGSAMAEGAKVAMNLGNLPGNICTPSYLANQAKLLAENYDTITTKILNESDMKKLGMGSLLSVTAGTEEPAKFIIMDYQGAAKKTKPTVLVGKGVTFDSGGISIKPGARMDEMKYDMCGAASVFGTINAVAQLDLKINLICVVGAVENMPSGKATKPGDVITSMSGKTIEVLNTDAEGRLVLCDALTYVERYKPKAVIDIATLTGACVVALGQHAAGLYANDEKLSADLKTAGDETYDRAWPMPLWAEYDKQLDSKFADIGNIGGPEAGSVTAACFLSRFTGEYRWAHLDIAGAAWKSGAAKGATGRPVSLLTQYLINNG
ncbi:Cytosol aminopeptidase [BD1-7 clade bacterium]|uniref:Probable cytosol aminopeptidase n=1 Tax=BD1-7 clade bacterium TaxID=2029982 RepID=A0A5S9QGM0_9GAMM|nr:Cytosol aminopeptidase [BD1-7 clade bacterium]CAA0117828.1 Cytosol aminopeptidase [BD1-7 clade bacterium]